MGNNQESGDPECGLSTVQNRSECELANQDQSYIGELDVANKSSFNLELAHAQSLATIANSLDVLSHFVTDGGLTNLLSGYAKSQAVKEILGGLAAHDGRNALDSRVLNQNAIEIVHQVEKVFDKFAEHLKEKHTQDPDIHNGENAYQAWKKSQEGMKKNGD